MKKSEIAEKVYNEQLEKLIRIECDLDGLKALELQVPHGEERKNLMQRVIELDAAKRNAAAFTRACRDKVEEYKKEEAVNETKEQ